MSKGDDIDAIIAGGGISWVVAVHPTETTTTTAR